MVIWTSAMSQSNTGQINRRIVENSSGKSLQGAQSARTKLNTLIERDSQVLIGYDEISRTNNDPITYKGQFHGESGATITIWNNEHTGQMFAIEVAQ